MAKMYPLGGLIVFDFWGAGNIGDDLMMDGFLRGLRKLGVPKSCKLRCLCGWNLSSQRLRFPEVEWADSSDAATLHRLLNEADLILGVGDTPFQLTSGDWFLRYLNRIFALTKNKQVVFINVGGESEIFVKQTEFSELLCRVSRCSTRDYFTYEILSKLRVKPIPDISLGSDLAHLSLQYFAESLASEKKYSLGLVLGYDTLSPADLELVKTFLQRKSSDTPTAFITGDTRDGPGFEFDLYKRWTHAWFSGLRKKLQLERPNYSFCTLEELIRPFAQCETVISSRFHGLLSAAWLGCKVAALGRSSKIIALAKAFDLPVIVPPFEIGALQKIEENAVRIPRERLESCVNRALDGIATPLRLTYNSN